jgi:hypothetical protein
VLGHEILGVYLHEKNIVHFVVCCSLLAITATAGGFCPPGDAVAEITTALDGWLERVCTPALGLLQLTSNHTGKRVAVFVFYHVSFLHLCLYFLVVLM